MTITTIIIIIIITTTTMVVVLATTVKTIPTIITDKDFLTARQAAKAAVTMEKERWKSMQAT